MKTIWTIYQPYYAIYLDRFGKPKKLYEYAAWITRKREEFRHNRIFLTTGPTANDEIRFIKFLYE